MKVISIVLPRKLLLRRFGDRVWPHQTLKVWPYQSPRCGRTKRGCGSTDSLQKLWKNEYQCLQISTPTSEKLQQPMDLDLFDEFLQLNTDNTSFTEIDEYESYCSIKPDPRITNIID